MDCAHHDLKPLQDQSWWLTDSWQSITMTNGNSMRCNVLRATLIPPTIANLIRKYLILLPKKLELLKHK